LSGPNDKRPANHGRKRLSAGKPRRFFPLRFELARCIVPVIRNHGMLFEKIKPIFRIFRIFFEALTTRRQSTTYKRS
jgi:hypothetical protein